jgi:hypothetical protein
MTRFKVPSAASLTGIREEFTAICAARDLVNESDSDSGDVAAVLPMSSLYAYSNGRISYPDTRIEAALAGMPGLRAAFRRMVMAAPTYRFERAIAASEGGPLTRRTEGAEIRFSPSRAHEDRVYIIIELVSPERAPGAMTVFDADDRAVRLDLPMAQAGIIQLLVRKDSEILQALEDPDTNIALM